MKPQVFFPYGVSNFAKVATQNYVYVDKTNFLEMLEIRQERFVVYLRPRRFGKSLFVSLLEHYYDINRKEQFYELFGKYYIGQHPTPLANSFRILFFNFSGINTSTPQSGQEGFNEWVRMYIDGFIEKYGI
ncbi:MAG: AAA family ATPase, partial [Raineya sp.]|nr:AAA family ATPase [Raineya sp.]